MEKEESVCMTRRKYVKPFLYPVKLETEGKILTSSVAGTATVSSAKHETGGEYDFSSSSVIFNHSWESGN